MNVKTKNGRRTAKFLGFLGLGLCGLCCALPVIGIIGGAGVIGVIVVHAENIGLGLLILSIGALAIGYYKKRRSPACNID